LNVLQASRKAWTVPRASGVPAVGNGVGASGVGVVAAGALTRRQGRTQHQGDPAEQALAEHIRSLSV
jgi:hypothetical protein